MATYRLADGVIPLWRAPGVLQLGLQAGAPIVASAPDAALEALRTLRQPRSLADVRRLVPHLDAAWFATLLRALTKTGTVIVDEPPTRPTVLVAGGGPLANDIARLLSAEGVRLRWLRSPGAQPPPGVDRHDELWEAAHDRPGLTVLAPRTIEHDRPLSDALTREGLDHLVVRSEDDRVVVGPLVLPGESPCARCLDLTRRDLDPAWPFLLAQLALQTSRTTRLLRCWAAATAVTHVLTFLAGGLPDSVGRTIELGLPPARPTLREWRQHAACACAQVWSATMPSTASA